MAEPWIATQPIRFGTALGYAPGDVVSDDVVKEHGLVESKSVARASSKAATETKG